MKFQKWGAIAAFYMAAAYIIGIVLFVFVLDYPHIVEPSQKVALLISHSSVMYVMNLIMYVLFGIALVVFTLALYERLQTTAPRAGINVLGLSQRLESFRLFQV